MLFSWIARERWGRGHEQSILAQRRALDGKARAEDSYLTCLTLRRLVDGVTFMQQTIGFMDQPPVGGGSRSQQESAYQAWAQGVQGQLDSSRKAYAVDRLRNISVASKGSEPTEKQLISWDSMDEEEIKKLGDQLLFEVDERNSKLERNARWADRIVVGFYIFGAILLLVGGQSFGSDEPTKQQSAVAVRFAADV